MGTLELAAAEVVLGILTGHELPAVCERALSEGTESRSLAVLAGIAPSSYDPWETEELWRAVLRETGIAPPTRENAARVVIEDAATRTIGGALTPKQALWRIVHGAYYGSGAHERDKKIAGESLDLGSLVGLYYEYDELGEPWSRTADELDRDVLEELRRVLVREPPN